MIKHKTGEKKGEMPPLWNNGNWVSIERTTLKRSDGQSHLEQQQLRKKKNWKRREKEAKIASETRQI